MKGFLRSVERVCQVMDAVGGIFLVFMMLLTVADVIMRYLGKPILGSIEVVSLAGALVIGCAMPFSSWQGTHVTVDFITVKVSPERRQILDLSTRIIVLALFIVIGFNLFDMGTTLTRTRESTLTLAFPLYPIAYFLGVCFFAESLVLLSQIVRLVTKGVSHE